MFRTMRQMVIWALIAVIAFGNGMSVPATADDHSLADFAHVASAGSAAHSHASHSVDEHSLSGVHIPSSDVGKCNHLSCVPDEPSGGPCCHVHAHCCISLATLYSDASDEARLLHESAMLFDLGAAVPLGAISYPLLRPPRAAA